MSGTSDHSVYFSAAPIVLRTWRSHASPYRDLVPISATLSAADSKVRRWIKRLGWAQSNPTVDLCLRQPAALEAAAVVPKVAVFKLFRRIKWEFVVNWKVYDNVR